MGSKETAQTEKELECTGKSSCILYTKYLSICRRCGRSSHRRICDNRGKISLDYRRGFPSFLKDIFACSNRLLQEIEAKLEKSVREEERLKVQAELTYLLAQQFIDAPEILGHFSETKRKNNTEQEENAGQEKDAEQNRKAETAGQPEAEIFYFAAMLELMDTVHDMRAGTPLFPAALKQHRLFLKKQSGEAAGYLSLKDDRLYYILVPLLEQKRAMVKIQVAAKQDRANMRGRKRYKNLDFWIKVPRKYAGTFPESIGLQIENLLLSYEKEDSCQKRIVKQIKQCYNTLCICMWS